MKLHYMGKYNLDENSLPNGEHKKNAVKFKEPENIKKLAVVMNLAAFMIVVLLFVFIFLRFKGISFLDNILDFYIGCVLPLLILFPHEILHAICFKKDVYLYTNFKQGMLFVFGPEDMSKSRFIFMSLLPNIVFGFIPFILGMIFSWLGAAIFGAIAISSGAGDYMNVFNAIVQMPKGSRVYMYGVHSFWYMPDEQ